MINEKQLYLFLFFFAIVVTGYSQKETLVAYAVRADNPPKIDGYLNDSVWLKAKSIDSFTQYEPYIDVPPTFDTYVKFLYDDEALYLCAFMYDYSPDSILLQLGNRDDALLNADDITIHFDPFNNNQDAYYFKVTASNVQSDWRRRDRSFNAVWQSQTAILENGWSVEIKIPFSAIRMPKVENHSCPLQITRNIRRNREFSKWAPEAKGVDNEMIYWGTLEGIKDIEPPVRLELTPYFSVYAQHRQKTDISSESTYFNISGGLDLKYGISESFTLDMTLLPDFSQVKSDDIVKNLSAFEFIYSEQRPFFLEAVDLFQLGGLFYSRRIGRIPSNYYSVNNQIEDDETIISNPAQVKLINALKVSGQTSKGLSLGIMNAVTDKVYAKIKNSEGDIRKVETEPLSNYNIVVFNQALRNNSSVYLINTNLMRHGKNENANVTGSGLKLYTPSNTYILDISGSTNTLFTEPKNINLKDNGYACNIRLGKVRGNFNYSYSHNRKSDNYDINDMGINYTNDETYNSVNLSYRIFEPFGDFLRAWFSSSSWIAQRTSTGKSTCSGINLSANTTTVKHLSIGANFSTSLTEHYDYYEPRTSGWFIIMPESTSASMWFSSDYRRTLALDGNLSFFNRHKFNNISIQAQLSPIVRVSDNFQFHYSSMLENNKSSVGFAGRDDSNTPVFGNRDIVTVENIFLGKYLFKNNLSLSIRFRHYWMKGDYDEFYHLKTDGYLTEKNDSLYFHDFNFNSFHVDLVFNWEFAPGSNITVVWKNSIIDEKDYIIHNLFDNLSATLDNPQLNMLTFKFIYYLDYHSIIQ